MVGRPRFVRYEDKLEDLMGYYQIEHIECKYSKLVTSTIQNLRVYVILTN